MSKNADNTLLSLWLMIGRVLGLNTLGEIIGRTPIGYLNNGTHGAGPVSGVELIYGTRCLSGKVM